MSQELENCPYNITGGKAGGAIQLPIRKRPTARETQFCLQGADL